MSSWLRACVGHAALAGTLPGCQSGLPLPACRAREGRRGARWGPRSGWREGAELGRGSGAVAAPHRTAEGEGGALSAEEAFLGGMANATAGEEASA